MRPVITNALTIDLEDWVQSVYDQRAPLTDNFIRNTHRLLNILFERGTRATFFVLGLAAERSPELIREIRAAGHEIQSHGYSHCLVHRQTRDEFRADILRSKKLLEDLIGESVGGYRAPGFSITRRTWWALEELVDCGFSFDSSIFPIRLRRYGVWGSPKTPYRVVTGSGGALMEYPVATCQLLGLTLPTGGGGYLRLFPSALIHRGVRQLNEEGALAVVYLHPYELNPAEWKDLGMRIPWSIRLLQGLGRRHVEGRLESLLKAFRFDTLSVAAAACGWRANEAPASSHQALLAPA